MSVLRSSNVRFIAPAEEAGGWESRIRRAIGSPSAAEFSAMLVNSYRQHLTGSMLNAKGSVVNALTPIVQLTEYSKKPVWLWAEQDFSNWMAALVEEGLAKATLAIKQGYIKGFIDYLLYDKHLVNHIQTEFGSRIVQVVTPSSRIVRRSKVGKKSPRIALPREDIALLLQKTDEEIAIAIDAGSKSAYPLMRDKAIVYLCYSYGLRRHEVTSLNLGSFSLHPEHPEFGRFGECHVIGKGTKERAIPTLDINQVHVLEWYLEYVRPRFLKRHTEDTKALFFSDYGNRLSDDQVGRAVEAAARRAGISRIKVTPHVLRHSFITHLVPLVGLAKAAEFAGHSFQYTTSNYYHPAIEEIGREVSDAVDLVRQANQRAQKPNGEIE